MGGELAGAYGPGYLQAGYDDARYHQAGEPDDTVKAYSVTAAVTLTGETRPCKPGDATYGGIAPEHAYGAWELAVRHEKARNDGNDGVFTGLALAGTKASLATLDQVTLLESVPPGTAWITGEHADRWTRSLSTEVSARWVRRRDRWEGRAV